MGLYKNISIICLIAALSFYGTEAAITGFTKPTVKTEAAGRVTAVGGTTTADGGTTLAMTASVTIAENTVNADGIIATVTATADAGGVVAYSTTSTEFAVHATNGAVRVAGTASVKRSRYKVVVVAKDTNDGGGATGKVTLTVTVNALPTFTSGKSCWEIADCTSASTPLGTYRARANSGEKITYTIIAGNTNSDFTSPLNEGKLATANVMDSTWTKKYTLVLQAVDDGLFPATATTEVSVFLEDTATTPRPCGTAGLLGSLLVVMAVLVAQFM